MAVVRWSPGIDSVSGALSKPKKSTQHTCGDYLIAKHRTAETTSKDCNRLYMGPIAERATPPSVEEIDARQRFGAIAQAVVARMQDLSKVTQDQIDFKAQKDLPGGKTTMRSYLWMLEAIAYDEAKA